MRLVFLLSLSVAVALASVVPQPKADDQDWWKTAIFYQVYPRSFKDGDNSGEGDLRGVIDKIDHFVDAGVTAIWLSPIYKSPQVDSGYDISDFRDIDPRYGTLADFEELVTTAHDKGLKVVMDFVPNHSSDQHEWFKKSLANEAGFKDYYVWVDEMDGAPPNNWLSLWGGSAWEWSAERGQYYLHQFSKQQPDLNYANQAVVGEMTDTLRFWMDKGIDGFRIDAIPYLFEDGMDDEPLSNDPNAEPGEYNYLLHIHTMDEDATYEQIYKWRKFVDDYLIEQEDPHGRATIVIMTEAYTTLPNTMKYYGTVENPGAHFSFNFQLITDADKSTKATGIATQVGEWMKAMPNGFVPNWVIGNHDNHRVATRYGKENVDGMNMVVMMLPGVAVTYNGEEIGMEDGEVTWEQCQDPSVCPPGYDPTVPNPDFEVLGRDFERTPFHWDNTNATAGFNEGADTWLPVSEKYTDNNLADQKADLKSHFSIYQALSKSIRSTIKTYSGCTVEAYNEDVLLIRRTGDEGEFSTILAFNVGDADQIVDVLKHYANSAYGEILDEFSVKLASGGSQYEIDSVGSTSDVKLKANEGIIFIAGHNGATAAQVSLLLLGFAALFKMLL